ncbi:hypothetical protein D3C78_1497590 [compost metagenome]
MGAPNGLVDPLARAPCYSASLKRYYQVVRASVTAVFRRRLEGPQEAAVGISSARLGFAGPEGWLWAKMTAAALCFSAAFIISLG